MKTSYSNGFIPASSYLHKKIPRCCVIVIHNTIVNIVYFVVHIVCEVDVIANSLAIYLSFCSTLNTNLQTQCCFITTILQVLQITIITGGFIIEHF